MLYLMEWCFESIGFGARAPVHFRGPGMLPWVWCGHQKPRAVFTMSWAIGDGRGACCVVDHFFFFLVMQCLEFLYFCKMEVMRLTFLQSCVWRPVNGKTQCSLQLESQTNITLNFLMWTGSLWKYVMVYLDPATISSLWMAKNCDSKAGLKFWHFASWE